MNFGPIPNSDLLELIPYGILGAGSLVVLLVTLALRPASRTPLAALLTGTVVLAAAGSLAFIGDQSLPLGGLLVHDHLGTGFALIVLFLSLLVLPAYPALQGTLTEGPGGFFSLQLLAICGALLMVFANHMLLFFVGLELLSLPLYVLTALNRRNENSSEAAFKYFLLGSVSSALFIYGTALIWGVIGTVRLDQMAHALASQEMSNPGVLALGVGLALAGLMFKLGIVPFHVWLPDVYEGAPAYVVAWMSGAVKTAAMAFALRLFGSALSWKALDLDTLFSWMAAASMILGSLAALRQSNLKRLLAYSSIAHAGYGCIALATLQSGFERESATAAGFYFLTYGIASLAAFIVLAMEETEGRTSIEDVEGLARRRPALAMIFSLALLSLAGLPPLAGFFGKFNIFALAVRSNHMGLVLIGVLTSVVSLAFYLKVIVAMYMKEPSESRVPEIRFGTGLALVAAAAATILFGLFPNWVLGLL
jgi:NADH-quinone oxidoreductase subunit N